MVLHMVVGVLLVTHALLMHKVKLGASLTKESPGLSLL